jgi:hypothetical protein
MIFVALSANRRSSIVRALSFDCERGAARDMMPLFF